MRPYDERPRSRICLGVASRHHVLYGIGALPNGAPQSASSQTAPPLLAAEPANSKVQFLGAAFFVFLWMIATISSENATSRMRKTHGHSVLCAQAIAYRA